MLTKNKGDIAVSRAIAYFMCNGFEVCLPIGDKRDYDLVIEKDGVLSTVQVKYAGKYASKSDKCCVGLRITGGNQSYKTAKKYGDKAFDYLYIYTERNQEFLAPWAEISARNEIWIEHPKYRRYNVSAMQG